MKKLSFVFAAMMLFSVCAFARPVYIHLLGDTIGANSSRPPRTGWGQALEKYALPGYELVNRCRSGLSTSSCRTAQNYQGWGYVSKYFKKGDFLVLNFAHNNRRKNISMEQFADDMVFFIREARAKGVTVVLATPVEERIFKNGAFVGGKELKEYTKWIFKIGADENVPVIDLNSLSTDDILVLGEEKSFPYYLASASKINDLSHLTPAGAKWITELFLKEAARQQLPIAKCFRVIK